MLAFTRVLCGTDLSEAADGAIRAADQEARLHGAELVLLHSVPTFPGAPMSPQALESSLVQRERLSAGLIEGLLDRVRQLTDRAPSDLEVIIDDGPADVAIIERGAELGADLVVLGSVGAHRRNGLGSTASNVVRRARTSVLVTRPGPTSGRVLVATDLAGGAGVVLGVAAEEARRRRTSLVAVHSLEWPIDELSLGVPGSVSTVSYSERALAQRRDVARQRLDDALGRAGVVGQTTVTEGPASGAVVGVAKAEQVSLIVIGSAGRRGLDRLLLGSVVEAVVREAPCPVLIVRGEPPHPRRVESPSSATPPPVPAA